MNQDALVAVAEDLEFLANWGGRITGAEIRRGSTTLRRLLVYDVYGQAWRKLGNPRQPKLYAIDLLAHVAGIPEKQVIAALALGVVNFRGCDLMAQTHIQGPTSPVSHYFEFRPTGFPGERLFDLTEYLLSPSGIVDGQRFSRRDVINYIANVKGGAHNGGSGRSSERELVMRVGKIEKRLSLFRTDGLLVELVAIAQAVGNSDDAAHYIRSVLGRPAKIPPPHPKVTGWKSAGRVILEPESRSVDKFVWPI